MNYSYSKSLLFTDNILTKHHFEDMFDKKRKSTQWTGWVGKLDSLSYLGLLSIFVVSPLPLGSDRGWAFLAISGLCFCLFAVHLSVSVMKRFSCQDYGVNSKINLSAYLVLIVSIWFFIQGCLHFPIQFLTLLSPASAEFYSSAYKVLSINVNNELPTLSLDYGQTLDKAILSLACFIVVILMAQLINTQQRLKIFCYVIILSGVFQALFGVLMTLTGKEYLFFTPKSDYLGHATGTFVNRNNLAGYLEMTLSLGVGYLVGLRKTPTKSVSHWRGRARFVLEILFSQVALLRGMLIIMVVGLLMTHSRMGNAAFFNALLITGGIAIFSSRYFRSAGFYTILISIVLLDIVLLGSIFDLDQVVSRIENTIINKEDRDEVVKSALTMIPDFWLTGSGAGTFGYVFPAYKQQFIAGFWDLAHNDYLQIFLEAGVIGSIPLCLFVILAVRRGWFLLRKGQNGITRGMGFAVIMATISLLIHSSVDFNLQIPANIILFVAILTLPVPKPMPLR